MKTFDRFTVNVQCAPAANQQSLLRPSDRVERTIHLDVPFIYQKRSQRSLTPRLPHCVSLSGEWTFKPRLFLYREMETFPASGRDQFKHDVLLYCAIYTSIPVVQ
jgi:hypothetical protein